MDKCYNERAKALLDEMIGRTSYTQIAKMLGLAQNTIYGRIRNALRVTDLLQVADEFGYELKVVKKQ